MKPVAAQLSKFHKKEIDELFNRAHAEYKSKELVLLTAPSAYSFGRILIIASKKVGNAPTRNLLRRQVKAIFYQNKLYQHKKDCIIIFNKTVTKLSFEQLQNLLIRHIHAH